MKLEKILGTAPTLPDMERLIGQDFWCGSGCRLQEEPNGWWSVWTGTGKPSALAVISVRHRFAFGKAVIS